MEFGYPTNPNLAQPLQDLRYFPKGARNCYKFDILNGKGNLNLIRASFMYGNYDGQNKLPKFDLYLDVNLWYSVSFKNASDIVVTEIVSVAPSDIIHVCLVKTDSGVPFISALELRQLNRSIYSTDPGRHGSLVLFHRWDIGSEKNESIRYPDDVYDRIWVPHTLPFNKSAFTPYFYPVNNSRRNFNSVKDGYEAPDAVMETGDDYSNTNPLELVWSSSDPSPKFYAFMYFASKLDKNLTRKLNISWNGAPYGKPVIPRYDSSMIVSYPRAMVGNQHRILISLEEGSLPPMLNAAEIYMFKQFVELSTYSEDVDAISSIKENYTVERNWVGDPCGPKGYTWEGLACNKNLSSAPRISSLNLSSSGLSGSINDSIAKLSSLHYLDLSNNHLNGSIPGFLAELPLKFLNLEGNELSGFVPEVLMQKSKNGSLELRMDDQNRCSTCETKPKKNKIILSITVPCSVVLAFFIVLLIARRLTNKGQRGKTIALITPGSEKLRFTYEEIVKITSNFEKVIGKGGFGTVYLGQIGDGKLVAIKMLSSSSSQGSKEFQTEAELLMKIHHKNLVSFVGYCDESEHLALIYTYMPNGNLKAYISENSYSLSWKKRLKVAIDAAQGLEYLHQGCKPPIVHRDVKTANILLGEDLVAKIADFGLSKVFSGDDITHVSTAVMGTRGYLDPEYCTLERLTEKSDVYSFGIVLLELITGKPAIIRGETHIVEWVIPRLEQGEVANIVDQRMQDHFDVNSISKALEIAMACIAQKSTHRPSMSTVSTMLKECLEIELSSNNSLSSSHDMHTGYNRPSQEYFTNSDLFTTLSAR